MGFIPLRHGDGPSGGLFVREQALQVLLAQIGEAASVGRGRVLQIAAEAGAGKSRLLAELGIRLEKDQPATLFTLGRARAAQASTSAFHPFRRAVESLAEVQDSTRKGVTRALKLLWQRAPDVLEQVPWVRATLLAGRAVHDGLRGPAPGAELAEHMDRALLDFFVGLATERPVVLALDDMQWADASSIDLVLELADRSAEVPLVILLAYRPNDIEAATTQHPLALALDRLLRYRRIAGRFDLDRLSDSDVARLIADMLGAAPSQPLLQWLVDTCAGNPFYVEEYVALLNDRGALRIVSDEVDWVSSDVSSALVDEAALPGTIGGVFHERISILGTDGPQFHVLQGACVLGGDFDVEMVADIGQMELESARQALSAVCRRSGLLRSSGDGYAFWHNLVRVYLEQELKSRDGSLYRYLHARAADHLEQRPVDADSLAAIARHLHEAGLHGRAVSACLAAVEALARIGGLHEAAHFATWAWDHARHGRESDRQVQAGLAKGRLLMDLRRVHAAKCALDATASLALELGSTSAAELSLELAKAHRMENDWSGARDRLREADALVENTNYFLRARVGLLTGEVALCGSPQDLELARTVLRSASTMAQPDQELSACILGHLALTELVTAEVDEVDDLLVRARAAAEASGNPATRFVVALFTTHVALARMDLQKAGESLSEMRDLADRNLIGDTDVDRYQGRRDCLQGRFDQAGSAYCRFLTHDLTLGSAVPEARSWVLSHVTLQIDEIRSQAGCQAAAELIHILAEAIRGNESVLLGQEPELLDLFALLRAELHTPGRLHERPSVRRWHQEHGGWSSAARAAFDFYGEDLATLRARLQA